MLTKIFKKVKKQTGVSFLEVMIAVALMGIVTTAILRFYLTQHRHYMVQEDITDIQQSVRASIDELTRNIRMAGHELPPGLTAIVAWDTNPDTIMITYQSAGCDTYLSAAMPQPSAELKMATDISCFWDGQWVFIYEPDSGGGEWFEITEVQVAAKHIQHNTMPLSKSYGKDAIMLSMTQVKFYIDTTNPAQPNLMISLPGQTPQVYAENVTDLQFKYRMKSGNIVDVPALVENIRDIMIYVQGRSRKPDYEDDSNDPYRYREFSTSVSLRNVGTS